MRSQLPVPVNKAIFSGQPTATSPAISHTATPNSAMFVVAFTERGSNAPTKPVISNSGTPLTWVEIGDNTGPVSGNPRVRITVWYADVSAGLSSQTVTLTGQSLPAPADIEQACVAIWTGVDTSFLSNFAFGISSVGDPAVTLAALSDSNSAVYAGATVYNGTFTGPTGYTSLGSDTFGSFFQHWYDVASPATSLTWTSAGINSIGFAIELRGVESNYGTPVTFGSAANKTGTHSITPTAVPVGSLALVAIASDNAGTTDAAGADAITNVSDNAGNGVYTLAAGYRNGQGAALGGSHVSLWYKLTTSAITASHRITVNGGTNYATAVYLAQVPLDANPTLTVEGSGGAAGDAGVDPSVTLSSLPGSTEYLFIGAVADETNAATGAAAGFTTLATLQTSGGGGATNQALGLYFARDSVTAKTFTPATAVDAAAVLVAFKATYGPPTIVGSIDADETGSDTSLIEGTLGSLPIVVGIGVQETDPDAVAVSGTVPVTGSFNPTEAGADTAAFPGGTVTVTGTFAATETGADSAALPDGKVEVRGTFAATETGADSAFFEGVVTWADINAELAAQEAGAAVPWALIKSAKGTSTTALTTASFAAPSKAGNLVVLALASDALNTTPDVGWTQSTEMEQATYHGGYLWWRISTGETSYQYSIDVATKSAWVLAEFEGSDAAPYNTSHGQSVIGSGDTYTTPPVTPSTGQRLLVAMMGGSMNADLSSASWGTWLNSFTAIDSIGTGGGGTNDIAGMAYRVVSGDGSTAYSTGATQTAGNQSKSGLLIAFVEAPQGTGGDTAALSGSLGSLPLSGSIAVQETGADTAFLSVGMTPAFANLVVAESGADTSALQGAVSVAGTLVVQETGTDTSAFTGAAEVASSFVVQEAGADSAALAWMVGISTQLGATEIGSDDAAFNAVAIAAASMAVTEIGTDTVAIGGVAAIAGTFAAVEVGADIPIIVGGQQVGVAGNLVTTETGEDAASISGSLGLLMILGSVAANEIGADTASVIGQVAATGTLSVTEVGDDTAIIVAGAQLGISGSLAGQETDSDSVAIAGSVEVVLATINASLAVQEVGSDTALISEISIQKKDRLGTSSTRFESRRHKPRKHGLLGLAKPLTENQIKQLKDKVHQKRRAIWVRPKPPEEPVVVTPPREFIEKSLGELEKVKAAVALARAQIEREERRKQREIEEAERDRQRKAARLQDELDNAVRLKEVLAEKKQRAKEDERERLKLIDQQQKAARFKEMLADQERKIKEIEQERVRVEAVNRQEFEQKIARKKDADDITRLREMLAAQELRIKEVEQERLRVEALHRQNQEIMAVLLS